MRMVGLPPPWQNLLPRIPSVMTAFAIPRMLTQTLSNLVTGNQDLLDEFWGVHMGLPEEQSVLM